MLQKFDPGEPRDERGRWTSGGSSDAPTSFISPNVSTLTFDEAVEALNGDRHKQVAAVSREIDDGLGIKSTNYPAIGAWADGAENSLMVVAPGASSTQIRVASAMKGYIADQKAVLVFHPSPTGQNILASFDATGTPGDLHDRLLKGDLSFHTLQPLGDDRFRIHVYSSDQATIDAIHKVATGFGVHPKFVRGDGEFIGTTKEDGTDREQRDDARQKYQEVIDAAADSPDVGGRNVGALWRQVRDHWDAGQAQGSPKGSSNGKSAEGLILHFWDESKHPRDPAGSPTGGEFAGGGGGDASDAAPSAHIEPAHKVEAKVAASVKEGAELARNRGLGPLTGSKSEHPNTIASRQPTSKKTVRGNYGQPSVESMAIDPKAFGHNVGLFRNGDAYQNFRPGELTGDADKDARTIIDHFKSNLHFLYEQAADKEESKLWYDGARLIVDNRAERYGFNDASVAAVYAALSPQKDWDQNVYLGDELMHIYGTRQDHAWDEQMDATAKAIWKKEKWKPMLALVAGKTLRELDTPEKKAFWIRTFNEAHSARVYREVRPDGSQGAYARTVKNKLAHAAWQTVANIAGAVRAIESDGDRDKISDAMGDKHKVRSFFNNILDPHSGNGDVTVDTHAVGAAMLQPLSGDSVPVHHNFGTTPEADKKPKDFEGTQSSIVTGSKGTYGLYADAYREVAQEIGIEPRQLQSITWVAKRNLFDRGLTEKEDAAIKAAWREYHDNPSVKLADVQKRIVEIAGGFQNTKMLQWSWLVADE